jgi:hypothetical protein
VVVRRGREKGGRGRGREKVGCGRRERRESGLRYRGVRGW